MSDAEYARRVADHAKEILAQGYTILENAVPDPVVDALARTAQRLFEEAGSPRCYSLEMQFLAPDVSLCPAGLVHSRFFERCPEHADAIVPPLLVDVLRRSLGDDMTLELVASVVADRHRTYFEWHMHIGGIDVELHRRSGAWPAFAESQRISTLLYIDDIDPDNGPLLMYPRCISDPTPPPFDTNLRDWPGQRELLPRRGTIVMMDQCTWHAVRAKTTDGIRSFVGCHFRSREAPPTTLVDESLRRFAGGGALLRSVLPR